MTTKLFFLVGIIPLLLVSLVNAQTDHQQADKEKAIAGRTKYSNV